LIDYRRSYVHGRLPYDRIAADPQLAGLLRSIPQRKIVSSRILFFSCEIPVVFRT
jgi:hypothetical protein